MTIDELNRDQLIEIKERYMIQLAIEGMYQEVTNSETEYPSMGDIANADNIIPDYVIFEIYKDTVFSEDDFYSTAA